LPIPATATQVQIALFPRLLATAEVAWTPQARRDYATFGERVGRHADRMAKQGIRYYHAADIPWQGTRAPEPIQSLP
jgi:hexosaminidase